MAETRIRVSDEGVEIVGRGSLLFDGADLAGSREVVADLPLSDLRRLLARWAETQRVRHVSLWLVDVPVGDFRDPDRFLRPEVEFEWLDGALRLQIVHLGDPADGVRTPVEVTALVTPLVRRHRWSCHSIGVDENEYDYGGMYAIYVTLTPPRGRTVTDALELGGDVLALLNAADSGELTLQTTLELLRAGKIEVLIGQHEGAWMDCKRAPYAPNDMGKLELAKDVAMFANANGGLIVLGMTATKRDEIETIARITPCGAGAVSRTSYRRAISGRIHPPPTGIELIQLPQPAGGDIWVISVPSQPEPLKPFLVHGAVISGKAKGQYISIVTRRDDEAEPMSVEAVHALLVAGRAALGTTSTRPHR